MLVQDVQVEPIRPPVGIRRALTACGVRLGAMPERAARSGGSLGVWGGLCHRISWQWMDEVPIDSRNPDVIGQRNCNERANSP
jgi:hypothetical protein